MSRSVDLPPLPFPPTPPEAEQDSNGVAACICTLSCLLLLCKACCCSICTKSTCMCLCLLLLLSPCSVRCLLPWLLCTYLYSLADRCFAMSARFLFLPVSACFCLLLPVSACFCLFLSRLPAFCAYSQYRQQIAGVLPDRGASNHARKTGTRPGRATGGPKGVCCGDHPSAGTCPLLHTRTNTCTPLISLSLSLSLSSSCVP
jgi:hypothetical protein